MEEASTQRTRFYLESEQTTSDQEDDIYDMTEFEDYTRSHENYHGYVDLKKRGYCKRNRLSILVACDSDVDKISVVNEYFNTADSISVVNKGLNLKTYSILETNLLHEPIYETLNRGFSSQDNIEDSPIRERKIWNLAKGYGVHGVNSVFVSPFSTWLYVFNADRSLGTQLDSLDKVLRTIEKFASHDKNDNFSECTFIAFMQKDAKCVQDVQNHIQSKHTEKYVYPDIFILDTDFDRLMGKLGKARQHVIKVPWSWVKLEADILQFCEEKGKGYISLNEVEQCARRQFEMSTEDITIFLKDLYERRDIIFDDKILDLLKRSDPSSLFKKSTVMLITDPVFLDKTFRDLVLFPETRDPQILWYRNKPEVSQDLKKDIISVNTLTRIWKDLDEYAVEGLADILVKFHLLIPYKCLDSRRFMGKYIVPALMTSLSSSDAAFLQRFRDLSLSPLIYWFAPSADALHREISGVHTEDFFIQLVTCLRDTLSRQANRMFNKMSSNTAYFKAGPKSQLLVTVSTHGCALVIKLGCLPNAMPEEPGNLIPEIRSWFEAGIQEIIENECSHLHWTVHVSACKDSIKPNQVEFGCLHTLGDLEIVAKELPYVWCEFRTDVPHIDPSAFSAWFCTDLGQQRNLRDSIRRRQQGRRDEKTLLSISQKVTDQSVLFELGSELNVPDYCIRKQLTNNPNQIGMAAYNVLYKDWYIREGKLLEPESDSFKKLMNAQRKAGLAIYMDGLQTDPSDC